MAIKTTMVADVTDLKRGTEQARDEFKKVGAEAEKSGRQLKAVSNAFDGAKVEGAARRAVSAVERIGGVTKLTGTELTQLERKVESAIEKFRAMGSGIPPQIQKVARDIAELRAHEEDLARSTDKATSALRTQAQQAAAAAKQVTSTSGFGDTLKSGAGAFAGGLGVGLGAGAGLAAITSLGATLRDIAAQGAALTPLQQSFERLQGGARQAADQLAGLRQATRGLVDEASLLQAANKGNLLGLDAMGVQFEDVARVATTLGRAMGQDAAKSVDDLTTAIARQSPMILDNLGIKVSLTEANDRYARSLGKSADALTDEEKKIAFAAAAMEAAREKAESLGESTLTVTEQWTRLTTLLSDGAVSLASSANESEGLAGALKTVTDELERIAEARAEAIAAEAQMVGVQDASAESTREYTSAIRLLYNARKTYADAINQNFFDAEFQRNPRMLEQALDATGIPVRGGPFSRQNQDLGFQLGTTSEDRLRMSGEGLAEQWRKSYADLAREQEKAAKAAAKLTDAQKELNQEAERAFKTVKAIGPAETWAEYADSVEEATFRLAAFLETQRQGAAGVITEATHPFSAIMAGPYFQQIGGSGSPLTKTTTETRKLGLEVRNVAQAFAQLAQIAGPSMNGVTRGIGTTIASVDAASQLVESLAGQFKSLGGLDAKGNFALSGRGRALAGSLAALTTGAMLGGMTSNPLLGGLLGAGGGAAAGALAGPMLGLTAGATMGVTAGIGAAAALAMAWRNRQAEKKALSEQRAQVIASAGGYEQFREAVEDAGFEFEYFLTLFNSNDVDVFTGAMNRLNVAIAENETRAAAMVKGLQEVARVQGVLSPQQIAQIRNMDPNGPGAAEVLAFAEQQRQQAEAGITTAIAALDTATAGGTQQMDEFQASIGAVTGSLVVLFDTAVRNGESAAAVLKRLAEPIQTLQRMLAASGMQPGAGFGQLSVLSDIATGTQTGPLVSLAQGLGQALAGFANTGMLSPDLFAELANGIGEAYHQLELFGKGGLEAARLMQPALQNIWAMVDANPALRDELDDTTLKLLDFAEQNGLVGEGFRPAIDRMIDALDDLIAKLTEFIDTINGIPKNVTTTITTEHQDVGGTPVATEPPPPASGGTGGDYGTGLAAGGIVTRPTRALIGEAGPEAVIPLSRLGRAGAPIAITVVSQIDGYEAARAVTRWQPDVYRTYGAA